MVKKISTKKCTNRTPWSLLYLSTKEVPSLF